MAVLFVGIACITAGGEPAAGPAALPDNGLESPDEIKQAIRDFATASGESVTAEDVVNFLTEHIHQAPLAGDTADSNIIFGSEYVFNEDSTTYVSAAALSSSKFVAAYQDSGNSDYGTAVICQVDGNTITFGSEYVFNEDSSSYVSAAVLSSSHFVVAYRDLGNSEYGTAVIGQVSGSTITFGSEYIFNADATEDISVAALSSTKFVVAYKDWGNSDYGTAVIGQVSGTAVSFDSEYVFNSGSTHDISAAALSSSKFAVAYGDGGNSSYGTSVIGQVSGSTITFGSEYVFNADYTYQISIAALSSSQFVVAYRDWGNSDYGTAVIGQVSGTAITFGSEYVFNSGSTYYHISVAALSSTEFVVAYRDVGNSNYGTAVIGQVSGTAITFGSEYVFNEDSTSEISAAALSLSKFAVAYRDWGNSGYGTAVIGQVVTWLTISSTSGGSVTTPGEGTFYYDYGTVVPIVAEPNVNYQFWEWTGTAVAAGKVADPCAESTTVTMHGNYTLIANFVAQKTLTVSSTSGGSVTAPGEGTFYYDYGTVAPIVAEPNVGCHFVEWTGTAVNAGKVAEPEEPSTTVAMDADYTLMANFARTTIFVDTNATGANNGTSWENAFNFLQDALAEANSNPDVNEIWVAQGIYTPDSNSAEPNGSGDREATFQLINGLTLKGGYADFGEPEPNERDVELYETILSGDLDGNDTQDLDPCDLWDDPNRSENSYHVVMAFEIDANAVLDGFTITGGNADGSYPDHRGGGIYCRYSSPIITNCTISINTAVQFGGGICCITDSNSTIANCVITSNTAGFVGGGVYSGGMSEPSITNCTVNGNTADRGGGIGCDHFSSPTLTNCEINNNTAEDYGGGIYSFDSRSNPAITNCTITGNKAYRGAGVCSLSDSSPEITNCILWGNTASDGNEIALYNSSTIDVNYCDIKDGNDGIYNDGSCTINWGIGNINTDPCFVDVNGPDGTIGTEDDNLRLSPDSPCIDAGDNISVPNDIADLDNDGNTVEPVPFDLDGRPRFADGDCNDTEIVDMGAYEFDWVYIGDFDYDCDVDFRDFAILGLAWRTEHGQPPYNPFCDISIPADKYIDWRDLDVFTDNWLTDFLLP